MNSTDIRPMIRCGNHGTEKVFHNTVADVRACFTAKSETARPATSQEARSTAIANLRETSPIFGGGRDPIKMTEAQEGYALRLMDERDMDATLRDAIEAHWQGFTKRQASALIDYLQNMPIKAETAPAPTTQAVAVRRSGMVDTKALLRQIPAGYYCVTNPETGKNHFYRVTVTAKGFIKVQEQASSDLFEVAYRSIAPIANAILKVGIEAAGLAYAQNKSRCYRCGRELTDNTGNPYFSQGLGPDCGTK